MEIMDDNKLIEIKHIRHKGHRKTFLTMTVKPITL